MSWLVLLMVGLAAAQTEDVEEMTVTMTMPVPTTEEIITEYSLKLYHLESATSSITIAWRAKIPENVTVEKYHVRTVKHGSESEIIGPDLPGNAKGYIIEDLIKESEWHICVIASLTNNSLSQEHTECMDSFTIPYIRPDSMYVLAIVVAVIVFLILCGYCSWRRAVSNAEKAEEDEAEPGDDESEEDKKEL